MLQEDSADCVGKQRSEEEIVEDATSSGGNCDTTDHCQSEEEASGEDDLQADPQN